MKLRLPREALPAAATERAVVLNDYFARLVVHAVELAEGWELRLEWPTQADVYVDPNIQSGLQWWSQHYGELSIGTLPTRYTQRGSFLLAVEDAWTLYSWSRWLQATTGTPEALTILHLDDHTDFMSPRVVVDGSMWRDAITGKRVDIRDPESVASAIESGAIGIGSFVAPFAHALPKLHVRHLCARPYAKAGTVSRLLPALEHDALLAPGASRLSLRQEPVSTSEDGHHYRATDDLDSWLADLPSGPILLHIDMDYFNCRYDGDSDWRLKPHRHDPAIDSILARIDEVFAALHDTGTAARIEDVVVSLSPGFFPAELWPDSIERLTQHLGG